MPQAVAQLPWGQIRILLDKAVAPQARNWYSSAALKCGWSRNVLLNMMRNRTMEGSGKAASNVTQQLSSPDSGLAQQVAKDPFVFEFLDVAADLFAQDAIPGRDDNGGVSKGF